jgi:hypothetical protein
MTPFTAKKNWKKRVLIPVYWSLYSQKWIENVLWSMVGNVLYVYKISIWVLFILYVCILAYSRIYLYICNYTDLCIWYTYCHRLRDYWLLVHWSKCIYLYIYYIYIYVNTYEYIYVYIYIYMYIYVYIHVYICIYVYIYIHVNIHIYICIYIYIYAYVWIHRLGTNWLVGQQWWGMVWHISVCLYVCFIYIHIYVSILCINNRFFSWLKKMWSIIHIFILCISMYIHIYRYGVAGRQCDQNLSHD